MLIPRGTLPEREQFTEQFNVRCPSGRYDLMMNSQQKEACLGFSMRNGRLPEPYLWRAIKEIVDDWHGAQEFGTAMRERVTRIQLVDEILESLRFTGFLKKSAKEVAR